MFTEETTTMIPVVLGEVEIRQRAQELAGELNQLDALREEKKASAREFKEREDATHQRIATLRNTVLSGVENFETPCQKAYDFEARIVYWQTEDGTKHHERPMRDDELGKATRTMWAAEADDGGAL